MIAGDYAMFHYFFFVLTKRIFKIFKLKISSAKFPICISQKRYNPLQLWCEIMIITCFCEF